MASSQAPPLNYLDIQLDKSAQKNGFWSYSSIVDVDSTEIISDEVLVAMARDAFLVVQEKMKKAILLEGGLKGNKKDKSNIASKVLTAMLVENRVYLYSSVKRNKCQILKSEDQKPLVDVRKC